MRKTFSRLALACAIGFTAAVPMTAPAQNLQDLLKHRQSKKNEWRNIAIGSGALSLLGLLKHDNTLFFLGAAGALYSVNRYEQDRRSQNKLQHTRSLYFSRPYFYRDGVRYNRHTVTKNGKKYYQFVKAKK